MKPEASTIPAAAAASPFRLAAAGAGLGLVATTIDQIWGGRDGRLATGLILAGSAGTLGLEYLGLAKELREPRRLDAWFIGGAGFPARKRRALAGASQSAFHIMLAGGTGLALARAIHWRDPAGVIFALTLLVVATMGILICFRTVVARDWIPLSRARFPGAATSEGAAKASVSESWIQASSVFTGAAAGWLAAPYAWLARRKLLFLLRKDPITVGLAAAGMLAGGAAFLASGDLFLCGFFALTGCMVTLASAQNAWRRCDAIGIAHGHLYPPERITARCDIGFAAAIAALYSGYFTFAAIALRGFSSAMGSQAVWQFWITASAFACLIHQDTRRPGPAMALLAFAYLGIGGVFFMFPGWGIALAAAALATSAVPCGRSLAR